ncbi:MAG: SusC/RagA family TonB-linked outer membrane protein [Bacteroidota bacterium]
MQKILTKPFSHLCWIMLLFLLIPVGLRAQETVVSGIVTDDSKNQLPGVNVLLKGTSNGTTTDENGNYRIVVPDGNATLIFSFIGFDSQEITVGNSTRIDIILLPDIKTLSEVVVVGYGTQRKADLTGAITSIKGESLREMPVTTVEQALQGRLAGVQVQQTSGQPGTGISVRVRGVSSIAGGNEPLYVIDGLPQFNDDVRGANGLATINPADIESIEVLKDAAASAIYGSRGANGVVIITTRSGKAGQPKITFESSLGFQQVRKKLDMMNSQQIVDYAKAYYVNSALTVPADLESFVPTVDTDWQDEVFELAPQFNSSLSISGGTDKSRFFLSGGFMDQRGVVMNTGYKRGSLRMNIDSKISDRFSIQSRLTASRGVQNGFAPSVGDNTRNFGKSGVGSILRSMPTVPVKNDNGTYTDTTPFSFNGIDAENPVAVAKEVLDQNTTSRVQGGVDFRVALTKGLTNTARLGGDYYHTRRDLYFPKILPRLGNNIGAAELGLYDKLSVLAEDFLEYKYDLSEGTYIEAIVGASFQRDRLNSVDLAASGFGSDDLKNYNLNAASSVSKPLTDVSENTIVSGFARVRFNYKEKYLFAASARRDGASVFAENNKYGVFPSVSAAWRVSEEPFISKDLFSTLKARISWGQAGNPAIKPYQSLLLGRTINTGQGAGTGLAVGLAPTFANPDLKWETATQTNIGADVGVFNDKYRLTFDYYIKTTSDLLALVQLPPSAGVGAGIGSGPGQLIDNVGEVENKGWEVTLGANVINSGDWFLAVDVNFSQNKNKITKTKDNKDVPTITGGNDASGSNSIIRTGEPLSAFYGPKFIGVDENGLPIHENVNGDTDPVTGADIINALDNQILGSPYPDLYYGINTSLKFKRFTFTTMWQGISGSLVNNVALFELTSPTIPNQFNKLAAAQEFYPNPSLAIANRHLRSSRFMESGDYFRLRNIRIDYNFNLRDSRTVKGLNIYFSGQNLVTFTDYSGFDPEVNTFNGNDRRQGVDLGAYPACKTYTLGFGITF